MSDLDVVHEEPGQLVSAAPAALRVLDLTDDLAGQAGRLLVGLGADVIRVEYNGDPASWAARKT